MIDFTVVIPTYNGASRIPDVLEKLRSQTGTEKYRLGDYCC
jgi:Glycosyl transferase family 2.